MSRKIARDAAMRMLYAYELTGELNQDMIQETIEPAALDAEDMKGVDFQQMQPEKSR